MWYLLLGAVLVILIIFSVICYLKILKLKKRLSLLEEDFDSSEKEHILQVDSLLKINYDLISCTSQLEKIKSRDNMIFDVVKKLKDHTSNIDVVINRNSPKKLINGNLKSELEAIIKEIDSKGKIQLVFPKEMNIDVNYDYRLLSAIKLLLLKSIQIEPKEKIKIIVGNIENRPKRMIQISLENIHFTTNKNEEKSIFALLDIKNLEILDINIDPDFLIISENFKHSVKKLNIKESRNVYSVVLELVPENIKRKREKPKALIVDDNKHIAKMNQEVLEEIGIESKTVYSADECLTEILTTFDEYDIIVTDNQMPEKNGTELIEDLRKIDGFDLPVVIVTGDSGQDNYFINICGFDGYIVKPLDKTKALKTIKKLIK